MANNKPAGHDLMARLNAMSDNEPLTPQQQKFDDEMKELTRKDAAKKQNVDIYNEGSGNYEADLIRNPRETQQYEIKDMEGFRAEIARQRNASGIEDYVVGGGLAFVGFLGLIAFISLFRKGYRNAEAKATAPKISYAPISAQPIPTVPAPSVSPSVPQAGAVMSDHLFSCVGCGKTIAKAASACPHCQYKYF